MENFEYTRWDATFSNSAEGWLGKIVMGQDEYLAEVSVIAPTLEETVKELNTKVEAYLKEIDYRLENDVEKLYLVD